MTGASILAVSWPEAKPEVLVFGVIDSWSTGTGTIVAAIDDKWAAMTRT